MNDSDRRRHHHHCSCGMWDLALLLLLVALVGLDEDLFFSWNRLLRSFKDMAAKGKRGVSQSSQKGDQEGQ
jgi:hypothetical protein